MGNLSLCADSARPPGKPTHQTSTKNPPDPNDSKLRDESSSLHVISVLKPTTDKKPQVTSYYTSNHVYKSPSKQSLDANNLPTDSLTLSDDKQWSWIHWLLYSLHWILLHSLACHYTAMYPIYPPWTTANEKSYPNDKKTHNEQKDTEQRRLDKKIRMDIFFATRKSHKMNGNRNKYPRENTFDDHNKTDDTTTFQCNIVYDPTADLILTWTNQRVHIYRRRGRRQFTYLKRQSENTFPRTALPIHGQWQASNFIMTHLGHWTETPPNPNDSKLHNESSSLHVISVLKPTSVKNNPVTSYYTTSLVNKSPLKQPLDANYLNRPSSHEIQTNSTKRPTQRKRKSPQNQTTQHTGTNIERHNPKKRKNIDPQVSPMSIKWHPQVRKIFKWTLRHMDAYLDLAEVAMEQNVEPG